MEDQPTPFGAVRQGVRGARPAQRGQWHSLGYLTVRQGATARDDVGSRDGRAFSAGMMCRAKVRMFRSASSGGMPPYRKTPTMLSDPTRSLKATILSRTCSGVPQACRLI